MKKILILILLASCKPKVADNKLKPIDAIRSGAKLTKADAG